MEVAERVPSLIRCLAGLPHHDQMDSHNGVPFFAVAQLVVDVERPVSLSLLVYRLSADQGTEAPAEPVKPVPRRRRDYSRVACVPGELSLGSF